MNEAFAVAVLAKVLGINPIQFALQCVELGLLLAILLVMAVRR